MPVSWVNQIKHPEPLYLYLLYGTHCHLEYTCFLLQYSIYHTRITSVCTCRLYCTVYTVNSIHKCSINKTFSVLMSPEVTTNVPDLCSNNTRWIPTCHSMFFWDPLTTVFFTGRRFFNFDFFCTVQTFVWIHGQLLSSHYYF